MRRKRRRKYCVALDDTGVAVGCLLADPRAVDQDNTETAFCEMQRHRCADNAGTENHCISTCHTHLQETLSLYMDCRRRERYQTPILTAAGVSPNEIVQRPRGRTHPLRPPWDAYSSSVEGLAVPPPAAFRPHLGEAIAVMLTLAFLHPVELRRHWTQPGLIAAA